MAISNIIRNLWSSRLTPQTRKAHPAQVVNSSGGYSFAVDDFKRMERFLILGNEGGSYYASEQKLTAQSAEATKRCILADGPRAVRLIVDVSDAGRAYRNSPAVFALAMAAGVGDDATRAAALAALPKVCRIATHLFEFVGAVQLFRGWGPALRKAVARWYLDREVESLAQQLLKYRQRGGWNHHAVLHLCHAKAADDAERNALFRLAKHLAAEHRDDAGAGTDAAPYGGTLALVRDFLALQGATDVGTACEVIARQRAATWEMVPTELLGQRDVWEALLRHGNLPMTALVRNLGRMTANGLLVSGAGKLSVKGSSGFNAVRAVLEQLDDHERLRKVRVHPVQCLAALLTYRSGRGGRGSLTWTPVPEIVAALDRAFYASFGFVEPTGRSFLYGIDVSGSMSAPDLMDVPGLSPRVASAAMAMTLARIEERHAFVAFSDKLVSVPVTAGQRLDDVCATFAAIPMGGTDCALPLKYARERGLSVDCFVVLTDSETWAGGGGAWQRGANPSGHVHEQLTLYRQQVNPRAKLVIVGMVANDFSCANPDDAGQLDVSGFDASVPAMVSEFAKAE